MEDVISDVVVLYIGLFPDFVDFCQLKFCILIIN